MEIVNGFHICYTMFILLQFTSYMKAECSVNEYKVLSGGHNVVIQTGVEPFYQPMNWTDRSKCFKLCALETFCHIWSFENGKCQIFHSIMDILQVDINFTLTTYYETKKDDNWFKMYFVKSGSEFNVADSFLGIGTYDSWGPEKCTRNRCSDFFRSNLIDVWRHLPIHKVKMLARRKDKSVSLVFNGIDSAKENWFTSSRVLESPWENLKTVTPSAILEIRSNYSMTFYISSSHNGCRNATGWFFVTETNSNCPDEKSGTYPQIMYAINNASTILNEEFERADDFSIFVSFKD